MQTDNKVNGCSIPMMILLSGPRMTASMSWAAQYAAFGPFLENLLPSYAVSLTQFLGPLIGIFVSPLVGVLSDSCTSSYGRRRPFLVFGAISSALCWTLMGYTREFGEMLGDSEDSRHYTGALTIFFYAWAGFTVNCFSTPAQLILSDFAGDRQTTAAAIGQAAFTLGSLSVALYIKAFGNPAMHLHAFLGMLSTIMVVVVGLVCVFAPEKQQKTLTMNAPASMQVKDAYRSIAVGLKTMPAQLLILAFIFFCRCYGSTSYHGAKGQFFGLIVFNGTSDLADTCGSNCSIAQSNYNRGVEVAGGTSDILFNSAGYFVSWLVPLFVRQFGAKNVITVGMIPQALFIVMAFCHVVEMDVTIVVLSAITQAFVDGTMVPVVVHVLGERNEQDIGMYVGVFNSFDCLGQLMNFGFAALLVTSSWGYALPIAVGGIISLIGFLASAAFFKVKLYSL